MSLLIYLLNGFLKTNLDSMVVDKCLQVNNSKELGFLREVKTGEKVS